MGNSKRLCEKYGQNEWSMCSIRENPDEQCKYKKDFFDFHSNKEI